ncbi:MAG: hypothetical protein INQ03_16460 [Candidatus Heimdallarchaeota archaeon]|nr:hypothetical protein [Candidatus Heimdallarchaeota archaeon]
MISHILVIDPSGVCIVDRNYGDVKTDPLLISGFLAAVVPRMKTLKLDLEEINKQLNERPESHFEAIKRKRWIIAGFSDKDVSRAELIYVLHEVTNLVLPKVGKPKGYSMMTDSEIKSISTEIDRLVNQKQNDLHAFFKERRSKLNKLKNRLKL